MNPHRDDPKSEAFELREVPLRTAPKLEELVAGLAARKRRRNQARRALYVSGLFLCFGIGGWLTYSLSLVGGKPTRTNPALGSIARTDSSLDTADRSGVEHVATSQAMSSDSHTHIAGDESSDLPFRVFANVHRQMPVFAFDERRDELRPVGFVRAVENIPIEFGTLSDDQIESIEAVLFEPPQNITF